MPNKINKKKYIFLKEYEQMPMENQKKVSSIFINKKKGGNILSKAVYDLMLRASP